MKKIVLYFTHILFLLLIQPLFIKGQGAEKYAPQEPTYWKTLLAQGIEMDSTSVINKALYALTTYYYYNKDVDQVNFWANYTDSVAQARKINPDVYYDAHRNRIIIGLTSRDMETSINDIIKLYNHAQNTSQEYGMACASELLGTMYQICHHDSAALVAYQDASERLVKIGGHLTNQIRLSSYKIEMRLAFGDLKEAEEEIIRFEELLKEREEEGINSLTPQDKDWYVWMLHSFYANLHLHRKQFVEAKEALDRGSMFYHNDSTILEFATYYYLYVKASYLRATCQYKEAIATLNQILDKVPEQDAMNLKADILFETGDFKGALAMYDQIHELTGNNNNKSLIRQMNSLRVLYDKNNQISQEKETQLNNLQAEENHRLLIYSVLISAILLLLSFILLRYLKQSQLLKNALENEKKSLLISQEKLSMEKQKAEEANQTKNIFIANISHEIRTPLNAIVGFSTLLAEGEIEEKDKPGFIHLINKNSDILLSLVNDVLDLSKMETGHFKSQIGPCELTACCEEALDSIRHQLAEGVTLTFTPQLSPYILNTDSKQLYQLLHNLLSNAVKFTLTGNISLTYEVDEVKKQVRFSVTDSGPGIPEEKKDQVFERFEKLNDYSQGTGLGLAICRTITEHLGGKLYIDPMYMNGTRFIFIHPIQ